MIEQIEAVIQDVLCSEKHLTTLPDVQLVVQPSSSQPGSTRDPRNTTSASAGIFITGPRGCGKTTVLRAVKEKLSSRYETLFMAAGVASSSSPMGQQEYLMHAFGRKRLLPGKSGKLLLIDDIDGWYQSNGLMSMLVSLLRMDRIAVTDRVFVIATLNPVMLEGQTDPVTSFRFPWRSGFLTIPIQNLKPEESVALMTDLIRTSRAAFRYGDSEVIQKGSWTIPWVVSNCTELIDATAKETSMDTTVFDAGNVCNIIRDSIMVEEDGYVPALPGSGKSIPLSTIANSGVIDNSCADTISEFQQLVGDQYGNILQKLREGILTPQLRTMEGLSSESFSGVIVEGPTGYGKTALVNQLAFECRKHFKIMKISCSQLVHKVVGDSERSIENLFITARQKAPTILVLDNIETLLGKGHMQKNQRTWYNQGTYGRCCDVVMDRLLSCFLTNLDGIYKTLSFNGDIEVKSTSNLPKVIVIATTRDISDLDSSIVRPGRLEEVYTLKPLSSEERKKILLYFVENVYAKSEKIDSTDLEALVKATSGWTPAEIKHKFETSRFQHLRNVISGEEQTEMVPEILRQFSTHRNVHRTPFGD